MKPMKSLGVLAAATAIVVLLGGQASAQAIGGATGCVTTNGKLENVVPGEVPGHVCKNNQTLVVLGTSMPTEAYYTNTIFVDASFVGVEDGSVASPFDTIGEAVTVAIAGDTIIVAAGTYTESVVISKNDITLKGQTGAILDGTSEPNNGIEIVGVSGVTIEGFDIRDYSGSGLFAGGVGIFLNGASNSHVKNNKVSGSNDKNNFGIGLWRASHNIVEGNEVSDSIRGIGLFHDADHNEIRNNVTSGTVGSGIDLQGHSNTGFPRYNIVEENEVVSSLGIGIWVRRTGNSLVSGSLGNQIRGNDVSGPGSDGIAVFLPGNIVNGNVITGFTRAIHISANDNVVSWNEIDGSFGKPSRGIFLQGSGNVAKWNDISEGRRDGILLFQNGDDTVVKWNTISGTTFNGILVQGFSVNKPNDNVIKWNQVSDSGIYGINLELGASRNLVKENTVTDSGTTDLRHDAASTPNTWTDNTCGSKFGADIPAC